VDCHDPHASNQNSLVKQPGGGVCFNCHDDKAPGQDETGHGIIDLAGCQSCHEPHGGSREKLLAADEPDLCLDCHDLRKMPSEEPDGTIKLRGLFSVAKSVAQAAASLVLSADGQHDHPIQGHRVLGELTPEELHTTESPFRDTFTCRTCHDPHKGRTGLLAGKVASRSEACAQCHMK
jgi:predicted CXXCH cytochrome family protein